MITPNLRRTWSTVKLKRKLQPINKNSRKQKVEIKAHIESVLSIYVEPIGLGLGA